MVDGGEDTDSGQGPQVFSPGRQGLRGREGVWQDEALDPRREGALMNWKLFAATFWLIFLAELGDKTQLAVMLQSAVHGKSVVFWAASAALVCSVVLGVSLGGMLSKLVSERIIHAVGGVLFLVFGVLMLYSAVKPGADIEPIIHAVEQPADEG